MNKQGMPPARPKNPCAAMCAQVAELRRTGFGALTHFEIEAWIARVLLFCRMRSLCEKDLRKLRKECLPAYRTLLALSRERNPNLRGDMPGLEIKTLLTGGTTRSNTVFVDSWGALCKAMFQYPEASALHSKLEKWTRDRGLCADWFRDAILRILCGWVAFPPAAKILRFCFPGSLTHSLDDRIGSVHDALHPIVKHLASLTPPPPIVAYNPAMQTRTEHAARAKETLAKYYLAQEERFLAAGFKPSTPKRARTGEPWEHIDWFIRFQIHRELTRDIASSYPIEPPLTESGVNKGIQEVAFILQTPLHSMSSAPATRIKRKSANSSTRRA